MVIDTNGDEISSYTRRNLTEIKKGKRPSSPKKRNVSNEFKLSYSYATSPGSSLNRGNAAFAWS